MDTGPGCYHSLAYASSSVLLSIGFGVYIEAATANVAPDSVTFAKHTFSLIMLEVKTF